MDDKIYILQSEICKIFTNPTRLKIIDLLSDGEKTVTELCNELKMRQPVVSLNLALLRDKRIVTTRRNGTEVYYSITNKKLLKACAIVREIILDQLADSKKIIEKFNRR